LAPFQVVGLVEPLVILPHRLIDGDGQHGIGVQEIDRQQHPGPGV